MSAPLRIPSPVAPVPPRLGFLGVGRIGCMRLEALAHSDTAVPAALYDPSVESLEQARAFAPDADCARSPEALLETPLDGVVIATPSALHAEQAIAALERGLAVFCQKPLARNAPETRRVVAAARAANRLLGVDLSYRCTKAMRAVRGLVRDDGIGEVFAAELLFHNAYGPDKAWFYDRARSGGGCVIDLGTHLVDLALWTLDFPRVIKVASECFAQGRRLVLATRERTVEDYAEAQLLLDTGAVVRLACSWKTSMGCDALISAVFHGTRGSAAFHNLSGSFFDFVAERYDGTRREVLVGPPDDWGGQALVSWAERLATGDRYDPAIERIVDVAETLDAIAAPAPLRML